MSEPTIYFPENVDYRLGFKEGRLWNTNLSPSPHGRNQKRKRWLRPKRQMSAHVFPTTQLGQIINLPSYGNNDPGSAPPKLTNEDIWGIQMRPFLDQVAGRYNNFFIFNPKPHFFYQMPVGGWNGGGLPLPITYPGFMPYDLPFRGKVTGLNLGVLPNVIGLMFIPVGGGSPLTFEAEDFSIGALGPHGASQLFAFAPPVRTPPGAGDYYLYVTVAGACERIPAVIPSDAEDIEFDWSQAEPDEELVFDIEEDFG